MFLGRVFELAFLEAPHIWFIPNLSEYSVVLNFKVKVFVISSGLDPLNYSVNHRHGWYCKPRKYFEPASEAGVYFIQDILGCNENR